MDKSADMRRAMVRDQLRAGGITDEPLLRAMERTPRHQFVPGVTPDSAYADRALPTSAGQTISQPLIVARMTELLAVEPGMRVLEVGLGSGYQAAILMAMGAAVVGIERYASLAATAEQALSVWASEIGEGEDTKMPNAGAIDSPAPSASEHAEGVVGEIPAPGTCRVVFGDGTLGYPTGAPYDRIIVTAGGPSLPNTLRQQLADPGRIVIPLGDRQSQALMVYTLESGRWREERDLGCRFVPLVGDEGWRD